jgi:hypothetical protein
MDQNSLTYYYLQLVASGVPTGQALFQVKDNPKRDVHLPNALAYNLYGDPSISLGLPFNEVLSAGEYHTCALTPVGNVGCWGAGRPINDHGQDEDNAGPFIQIGSGALHSCGLRSNGSVDCWGANGYDQSVDQPGPFIQLAVGGDHNCGLRSDGSVDCWGRNDHFGAVDQDGPYTQISAGWEHTCGLTPYGKIECWGDDFFGQLTSPDRRFVQVDVGWGHTCGLTIDGEIDCWGRNEDGQAEDRLGPFTQVSAGGRHTCGLKTDGKVECWGLNTDGQAVGKDGPYVQISAGGTWKARTDAWGQTCGLKADGEIDCWGSNLDGQTASPSGPFGPNISDGNVVANYSFEEMQEPWKFHHSSRKGSFSLSETDPYVGDRAALIEINTTSANMQMYQKDIVLEPNTSYELSFAAKTNEVIVPEKNAQGEIKEVKYYPRLRVRIHRHVSGEPRYAWGQTYQLADSDWTFFRFRFRTENWLTSVNNARLSFWMAGIGKDKDMLAADGAKYNIDHVTLRPIYNR